MRHSQHEITAQLPRAELLGLLDTMSGVADQRVTAPFATVEMPPEPVPDRRAPRWAIVLASCVFTLALAGLLALAA